MTKRITFQNGCITVLHKIRPKIGLDPTAKSPNDWHPEFWPQLKPSPLNCRPQTLMRATDGRTPYWDFVVNAFAFLNVYTCLEQLASDAGAEDAEKVADVS